MTTQTDIRFVGRDKDGFVEVAIKVPTSLGPFYLLNAVLLAAYPPAQKEREAAKVKVDIQGHPMKMSVATVLMMAFSPMLASEKIAHPVFGEPETYRPLLDFFSEKLGLHIVLRRLDSPSTIEEGLNDTLGRRITLGYEDDGTLFVLAKSTAKGYQTIHD